MSRKITIDGEIVFFPEERKLRSTVNNLEVTVFSTGARCLEYLLDNNERTVSQKELTEIGWLGENSVQTVAQATYYQCLVDLRRCLKEIKYGQNLIVTIRGQGVRINPEANIVFELITPGERPAKEVSDLPLPEEKSTLKSSVTLSYGRLGIALFAALTVVFFALYMLSTSEYMHSQSPMADNYRQAEGFPDCYYFNTNNIDSASTVSFLKKKGYTCGKNKNFYISHFSVAPRLTLFSCSTTAPIKCESVTYIEDIS